MNVYEDEIFEKKMDQITDQLGYLFLDMVLMSVKKINAENTILKEFLEARIEESPPEVF